MLLIYILIIVFLLLIGYQFFLGSSTDKIIEGLENQEGLPYKPYNVNDPNNALILAQQNAGNIEVLKQRMDELNGVKQSITDMQNNINSMQVQVDGLVEQQSAFAQELAGSTPPEVTGTEGQETPDASQFIEEDDEENQ